MQVVTTERIANKGVWVTKAKEVVESHRIADAFMLLTEGSAPQRPRINDVEQTLLTGVKRPKDLETGASQTGASSPKRRWVPASTPCQQSEEAIRAY
jgi:hypothetical protein